VLCAGGACTFACKEFFADCNHDPADGCEVYLYDDPQNCGGCGKVCGDGVICWRGACGCPSGFLQCGSECVRVDSDANNCGSCGNVCAPPKDGTDPRWVCGAFVTPANTDWTCASGACSLQCKGGWGDCNHDFCGDGCERDLTGDPKNCGACGHACAPGAQCIDGACLCESGGTLCKGECVDFSNDPLNCGGCGWRCPGPSPADGGGPACVGGQCGYVCNPGWADCDGDVTNGCEVNVASDPLHCGACDHRCKGGGAQPCVGGKCLSKECEAGGPR
jgi:hypothetical protein